MKLNLTQKDVEKLVESIRDPQLPNEELVTAARKYRLLEATRLAEESWEGCHGCDEIEDKTFKKKSQWTKVNKHQ